MVTNRMYPKISQLHLLLIILVNLLPVQCTLFSSFPLYHQCLLLELQNIRVCTDARMNWFNCFLLRKNEILSQLKYDGTRTATPPAHLWYQYINWTEDLIEWAISHEKYRIRLSSLSYSKLRFNFCLFAPYILEII